MDQKRLEKLVEKQSEHSRRIEVIGAKNDALDEEIKAVNAEVRAFTGAVIAENARLTAEVATLRANQLTPEFRQRCVQAAGYLASRLPSDGWHDVLQAFVKDVDALPSAKPTAEPELICPVCKKPVQAASGGNSWRVCCGAHCAAGPVCDTREAAVAGWFKLTNNRSPAALDAAIQRTEETLAKLTKEPPAEPAKLSPCLHCGGSRFSFVDCDGLVINPGRTQCVHCTGCLAAGPQGHDHAEAILLHNQLSPDLTRLGELCRDINASYALAGKPLTEFRAVVNKLFPTVTQ